MFLKDVAPPFAVGHTAEIYAWENEYVLKLFYEWFPLRAIEHEARVARIVHHTGLPAPAVVGDIVKINGRYGLIYERVSGISMLETLTSRPWALWQLAQLLAELQATIHKVPGVPGLPSQHEKLRNKIQSQ